MSAFERLLVPGCTELPVCRCGMEMQIASLDQIPARSDVHIRVMHITMRCSLLFGLP